MRAAVKVAFGTDVGPVNDLIFRRISTSQKHKSPMNSLHHSEFQQGPGRSDVGARSTKGATGSNYCATRRPMKCYFDYRPHPDTPRDVAMTCSTLDVLP